MKATYTAAQAQTKIGEAVSGISTSMSDAGLAMQRTQDKIASMQARAGAMDELLASGALTDLTHPVDDIQAQLDQASSSFGVEAELAALKAETQGASPAAALPDAGSGAEPDGDSGEDDDNPDAVDAIEVDRNAAGGSVTQGSGKPPEAATAGEAAAQ